MEGIYAKWREELIQAGILKPNQDIENMELAQMYQRYLRYMEA